MDRDALPSIFLAFANDRGDDRNRGLGYLRNLPEEARLVQEALRPAEEVALRQVVLRQNVTLGQGSVGAHELEIAVQAVLQE